MAKWVTCKECGHKFASNISRCPECGKWRLTVKAAFGSLFGIAFFGLVVVGMVLGFGDDGNGNIKTASGTNSNITSSVGSQSADNSSFIESESEAEASSRESSSTKPESTTTSSNTSSSKVSDISSVSEVTSSTQSVPTATSYPVGTIIKNDLVYSTIPKFFLDYLYNNFGVSNEMSFDDFAYSIKDEEKNYGYTKIIKNSNGDATLVLPWSKLTDMSVKRLTKSVKYIHDFENEKFIKKIGHTEKFDKFEIILDTEQLNEEQKASLILFGTYFLEYQYVSKDGSQKCDVVLVYPDSSKETLSFPNIIK